MNVLKKNLVTFFIFCSANCVAQTDTTKKTFHLFPVEHSPRFAGISSAILPGAGQVYNKKYWKLPIVYASGATVGFFIYYNYTIYKNFRDAYVLANDDIVGNEIETFTVWNPLGKETYYPSLYDAGRQAEIQEIYRKYLDMTVIAGVAVYGLNILDAVVDAHLYNFNINDDLSLNIHPSIMSFQKGKSFSSLTLQLNF